MLNFIKKIFSPKEYRETYTEASEYAAFEDTVFEPVPVEMQEADMEAVYRRPAREE